MAKLINISVDGKYIAINTSHEKNDMYNSDLVITRELIGLSDCFIIKIVLRSDNVQLLCSSGLSNYFKRDTKERPSMLGDAIYLNQTSFKECLSVKNNLNMFILSSIDREAAKLAKYLCNSAENMDSFKNMVESLFKYNIYDHIIEPEIEDDLPY
jgi:hypothetical protein